MLEVANFFAHDDLRTEPPRKLVKRQATRFLVPNYAHPCECASRIREFWHKLLKPSIPMRQGISDLLSRTDDVFPIARYE